MECPECKKQLNNEEDAWGHDCEVFVTEIKSKRFKDTRTGEIVTQFSILDIKYMEELKD